MSSAARNAAHVTQNTPRSSGNRDCGSAGYGFAPVKRRRRPVTDGGVGARLVGSLIDLPRKTRDDPIAHLRSRWDQCDDEPRAAKGTPPASATLAATRHAVSVGVQVRGDAHVASGVLRDIEDVFGALV